MEKTCAFHRLPYTMICTNKNCNLFPLLCDCCDLVHISIHLSDIKDVSKLFDDKDQLQRKKKAINLTREEFELEIQQLIRELQELKLD